jgi:hypothetical protein
MNVRLILIGMVTGLLLPLAAANAGAVFNPGLTQSGAGADLVRGTTPSAGNFGRDGDEDKGDKGDDHKCDKDNKGDDHKCEKSPCDKDHDRDDHKCDKSPSIP